MLPCSSCCSSRIVVSVTLHVAHSHSPSCFPSFPSFSIAFHRIKSLQMPANCIETFDSAWWRLNLDFTVTAPKWLQSLWVTGWVTQPCYPHSTIWTSTVWINFDTQIECAEFHGTKSIHKINRSCCKRLSTGLDHSGATIYPHCQWATGYYPINALD